MGDSHYHKKKWGACRHILGSGERGASEGGWEGHPPRKPLVPVTTKKEAWQLPAWAGFLAVSFC